MNDNTKRFVTSQLLWMAIYFGIAVSVTFLLPFPYSFLLVLAIIAPLSLFRRRMYLKRLGRWQGSFFGSGSARMFGPRGIDYYCINCGTKHRQIACPNCGSKMKKAGFES